MRGSILSQLLFSFCFLPVAGIIQGFSEASYRFYADDIYLYVYHFLLYFIVIFPSFYLFYTIFCQALYNFISVTIAFINKFYLLT